MKKNNWTLMIFLVIGLLVGTILSELVAGIPGLSLLAKSAEIRWEPAADLHIIQYDVKLLVKLNLASLIGLTLAFLIYRKL